jgi:hypothetical protein
MSLMGFAPSTPACEYLWDRVLYWGPNFTLKGKLKQPLRVGDIKEPVEVRVSGLDGVRYSGTSLRIVQDFMHGVLTRSNFFSCSMFTENVRRFLDLHGNDLGMGAFERPDFTIPGCEVAVQALIGELKGIVGDVADYELKNPEGDLKRGAPLEASGPKKAMKASKGVDDEADCGRAIPMRDEQEHLKNFSGNLLQVSDFFQWKKCHSTTEKGLDCAYRKVVETLQTGIGSLQKQILVTTDEVSRRRLCGYLFRACDLLIKIAVKGYLFPPRKMVEKQILFALEAVRLHDGMACLQEARGLYFTILRVDNDDVEATKKLAELAISADEKSHFLFKLAAFHLHDHNLSSCLEVLEEAKKIRQPLTKNEQMLCCEAYHMKGEKEFQSYITCLEPLKQYQLRYRLAKDVAVRLDCVENIIGIYRSRLAATKDEVQQVKIRDKLFGWSYQLFSLVNDPVRIEKIVREMLEFAVSDKDHLWAQNKLEQLLRLEELPAIS